MELSLLTLFIGLSTAKMKTLFGATPIQFFNESFNEWSSIGYTNNTAISDDVDIISIHEDAVYGVPYAAFWNGTMNESLFPIPWVEHLELTVYQIKNIYGNKPIFLSLPFSNGKSRTCPGHNVTHDHGQQPFYNCTQCYNYNITENPDAEYVMNAFKSYTKFMIYYFMEYSNISILYINNAVEINEYSSAVDKGLCPLSYWYSLINYANDVYQMIKSSYPNIKVAPSFVAANFMGFGGYSCPQNNNSQCIIHGLQRISTLKYDLFYLSSYPWANEIRNYSEKQWSGSNYLNQIFDVLLNNDTLNPNKVKTVGIAETGYQTTNIVVEEDHEFNKTCFDIYHSNISMAMDWLNYLGNDIQNEYDFELFIWWSDANIEPTDFVIECDCKLFNNPNQYFCQLQDLIRTGYPLLGKWIGDTAYKMFGTMGLRNYTFNAKSPMIDLWNSLRPSSK